MRVVVTLLLASLLASGCFRYQTQVPGVVDLRSDASAVPRAEVATPDDDTVTRPRGLDLVTGKGVRVEGAEVHVEERHVFLRGLVPVWNPSAHEELSSALALSGALAEVEIGEEYGPVDVVLSMLASLLPVVAWAAPSTYTFYARGEALFLEGGRGMERTRPAPLPLDAPAPPPLLEDEK